MPVHIELQNPTFEIEDLKRLIKTTTKDLVIKISYKNFLKTVAELVIQFKFSRLSCHFSEDAVILDCD